MQIEIPGLPIAQPRHRVGNVRGHARAYLPSDSPVHAYKAQVRMTWSAAHGGQPLTGPLEVSIMAVFPRPRRLVWKSKPMPREPHTGKPDLDNIAKSTLDSLNGLAWGDDSQVVLLHVGKCFAAGDEQARVIMEVEQLQEQ